MRTDDKVYPSGVAVQAILRSVDCWSETLEDGTIRRYDNSDEETKGHKLHVAPDPEPEIFEFPDDEALYERFWDEIPKLRDDPPNDTGDSHD